MLFYPKLKMMKFIKIYANSYYNHFCLELMQPFSVLAKQLQVRLLHYSAKRSNKE